MMLTHTAPGVPATPSKSLQPNQPLASSPSAQTNVLLQDPKKQIEAWSKGETIIIAKPFQVTVDTPTDWAAAVITPLVVALVATWFAWYNQRYQIRSTTATFRHSWQTELRTAVTNYVGAALEINMKCLRDSNFLTKDEAEPLIAKITTTRALIRVMLDRNKAYTTELVSLMDDISDNLDDSGTAFDSKMSAFINKVQEVLELAWNDIRRDLQGKKK